MGLREELWNGEVWLAEKLCREFCKTYRWAARLWLCDIRLESPGSVVFVVDSMTCGPSRCGNRSRNKEELKRRGMKVRHCDGENVRETKLERWCHREWHCVALYYTNRLGQDEARKMDGRATTLRRWHWGELEVAEVQILNFSLGLGWIRSRTRISGGNVYIWWCRPDRCLVRTCTQLLADHDYQVFEVLRRSPKRRLDRCCERGSATPVVVGEGGCGEQS